MLDGWLATDHFVGGSQLTYADIAVGVSMFRWMTMPNERIAMPNLEAWYSRLQARSAFRKSVCLDFADMYGVPGPASPI
jgi:glutathione S-transferase